MDNPKVVLLLNYVLELVVVLINRDFEQFFDEKIKKNK